MRIGIVPCLDGLGGGLYQYSLSMLRGLEEWAGERRRNMLVSFVQDIRHPAAAALEEGGWIVKPLYPPPVKHHPSMKQRFLQALDDIFGKEFTQQAYLWLHNMLGKDSLPDPEIARFDYHNGQRFREHGVELMIYPAPKALSFEIGIPYVMAIHDLQHKLQPEFPEVSANGELQQREYLFRNGARYATLLLADSDIGKEDILTFYGPYGVTPDRVKVLPFLPAHYLSVDLSKEESLRIKRIYHLPERYLFYPAQFWPHKNHARIVEALVLVKEMHQLKLHIVFCGTHVGEIRERNFREVMDLAYKLKVPEQIQYLGYVPDKDLSGIYYEAVGLVMPTFFGPTNIPVLEAWAFDCPVITSDIRGIREQVGDAGLLVDPRSVEAIAEGMYRLWTDESLCKELVRRGRQRLGLYRPEDFRQRLAAIIDEAMERVRKGDVPSWG